MVTKVTNDVLADNAVKSNNIENNSITFDKLVTGALDNKTIENLTVGGTLLLTNQPCLRLDGNFSGNVLYTAGQQVLNSTHFYQKFIRGSMIWDETAGTVTVPETGFYSISISMYQNGATAGRFQIRKDGALTQLMHVPASANGIWTVSLVESMAANQYIDIIADGFALGTFYLGSAHSSFSMHLLG